MESIQLILFVGICYLIFKAIVNHAVNAPTWKGLIVSLFLGMFLFYLVLCCIGVMGTPRNRKPDSVERPDANDHPTQPCGRNDEEGMGRRYAYDKPSQKGWGFLKYLVGAYLLGILLFMITEDDSESQDMEIVPDCAISEDQQQVTSMDPSEQSDSIALKLKRSNGNPLPSSPK